jgi:hypothetical protein
MTKHPQIQAILRKRYPDLTDSERERMIEELYDLYTGLVTLLAMPEGKAMEKVLWYAKYHDFVGEYQRRLKEMEKRMENERH